MRRVIRQPLLVYRFIWMHARSVICVTHNTDASFSVTWCECVGMYGIKTKSSLHLHLSDWCVTFQRVNWLVIHRKGIKLGHKGQISSDVQTASNIMDNVTDGNSVIMWCNLRENVYILLGRTTVCNDQVWGIYFRYIFHLPSLPGNCSSTTAYCYVWNNVSK